jgi:glycosyltransferase involved in cell wall biosynthesis
MINVKAVVGIVSLYDPKTDRKAHSGILYKINEVLEKSGCETIWVRTHIPRSFWLLKQFVRLINKLTGRIIYLDRTFFGSYLLYKDIDKSAIAQSDYLMVIHYQHILYHLETEIPIIYHSDSTFDLANNYYLHNMFGWNERQAEYMEKTALKKPFLNILSSNWCKESVSKHYGIQASKCKVLEYGHCIDTVDFQHAKSDSDYVHLLFFAVEWERKGGDVAVLACEKLIQMGVNIKLTIVGIKKLPQICRGKQFVEFVGYLNKNIQKQNNYLKEILARTDIMILPTRAECSAIAFCECSAYGIPVVTYDTGGVANYIINGKNGYRLPLSAGPDEFAFKIKEIIDEGQLEALSEGGKLHSEQKLNWDNWTSLFSQYIQK